MPLNPSQSRVVEYFQSGINRVAIIEAGPGSGKTYTATNVAVNFIEHEMNKKPMYNKKVLILTFSNNAESQIKRQLEQLNKTTSINRLIEITNFHSFFYKYINAYSRKIGITSSKVIVLSEKQRRAQLRKQLSDVQEINIEDSKMFKAASEILEYDNTSDLKKSDQIVFNKHRERITKEVLSMNSNGLISFSDMGYHTTKLFQNSKQLLRYVSEKYPLIIVDEYQDVSDTQDELIDLIWNKKNSLLFFSDSKQQIYLWRGAKQDRINQRIMKHKNVYSDTFVDNYRYGNRLDIKEAIDNIKLNRNNVIKETENIKIHSVYVDGDNLSLRNRAVKYKMLSAMFWQILNNLPSLREKSVGILCFTNEEVDYFTSKFFEKNFMIQHQNTKNILQNLVSELMFWTSLELTDEIVKTIPKLGVQFLFSIISETKIGTLEGKNMESVTMQTLSKCRKKIIKDICKIKIPENIDNQLFYYFNEVYKLVLEDTSLKIPAYIKSLLNKVFANKNNQSKIMNIYLSHLEMLLREDLKGIHVLTVHKSKGKEFDEVFIVDSNRISEDENLYYVALSRTKEKLYLLNWTNKIEK